MNFDFVKSYQRQSSSFKLKFSVGLFAFSFIGLLIADKLEETFKPEPKPVNILTEDWKQRNKDSLMHELDLEESKKA